MVMSGKTVYFMKNYYYMRKALCFILALLITISLSAQLMKNDEQIVLKTSTGELYGELQYPFVSSPVPVAVIIAGSGPTDRDGNQSGMKNNSLKMLADGLYKANIATLCFDKRGVGASKKASPGEENLRFEHYIEDVRGFISLLKKDKRFSEVIVIGHSEGALIGLVASLENKQVGKYVSLAGIGSNLADVMKEQLSSQPGAVKEQAYNCIDRLQKGETFSDVPVYLQSLFRPSVQPYLISAFKYNPVELMSRLIIPSLIIQGATDIQVSVKDAELLAKANPKAKKVILKDVNHVLKHCTATDQQSQIATYTNPSLPVSSELITAVVEFILNK